MDLSEIALAIKNRRSQWQSGLHFWQKQTDPDGQNVDS